MFRVACTLSTPGLLVAQAFAPLRPLAVDLPSPTTERDGAVWAGDLDGDRRPDLLVVLRTPRARIWACTSAAARPPADFAPPRRLWAGEEELRTVEGCEAELLPRLADLNGDGNLDLLVLANAYGFDYEAQAVPQLQTVLARVAPARSFAGDGRGNFRPGLALRGRTGRPLFDISHIEPPDPAVVGLRMIDTRQEPRGLTTVDWNGDGRTDLAVVRGESLQVHLATAEHYADALVVNDQHGALDLEAGSDPWLVDFDGDRVLDLLTVAADQGIALRSGRRDAAGDVRFGLPKTLVAPPAEGVRRRLAVVDWDRDGRLDLLLAENREVLQPVRDLTADELTRRMAAEDALRGLEAELATLLANPPKLSPASMRERRTLREALEARMAPHRATLTELREIDKPIPRFELALQLALRR